MLYPMGSSVSFVVVKREIQDVHGYFVCAQHWALVEEADRKGHVEDLFPELDQPPYIAIVLVHGPSAFERAVHIDIQDDVHIPVDLWQGGN